MPLKTDTTSIIGITTIMIMPGIISPMVFKTFLSVSKSTAVFSVPRLW